MSRPTALALYLLFIAPATVLGQDRRPYVGGSLIVSTQTSERPGSSPSFPTSGVGGTALGLAVEAGGFLSRRVSIAFEASIPARIESIQETDYFLVFRTESRHRDLILSGLFHAHLGADKRVRISLVGGPSVVRESTLQRTAYQSRVPPDITAPFGPYGLETSFARWTVGLTGGADIDVPVAAHVSLVPQLRFHWIQRAEAGEGDSGFLGLSPRVWRPALGVRASF